MTAIPDPAKSMGASVPVFLALMLLSWLYMLRTISLWIGKTPVPGRETDRVVLQAYSGAAALLVWIFLAALLLIASSKGVVPPGLGTMAWFVHPLSCAAALAAIAVLYRPERQWPVAIPAAVPILIGGYVLYAFLPSMQAIPLSKAGFIVWWVVLILSISVVPEAFRFAHSLDDDGSIDATPGPKLDRWLAKQRERRRADGLEELRKMDEETKLYEVEHLIRGDSPVLQEALEFMRHLPNRQTEATQMLESQNSSILEYLADIDLKPTQELCSAARHYLSRAVRERQGRLDAAPSTFVGAEFQEGVNGIRWISENCGCDAELALMEAYARSQIQDAPDVKKFLAALAEIKARK